MRLLPLLLTAAVAGYAAKALGFLSEEDQNQSGYKSNKNGDGTDSVMLLSGGPLYAEIEPYQSGFLKVSDLHTIYWEECGNPQGKPVVFLHGGPGGGTNARMRRFFNPELYRIILFDQRGCGRSTPHACLEENTTWHLVDDIEKLRHHLGVKKWLVFGGSWGSTLALAYAQKHPEFVTELVLRGIFLAAKKEIDWFYQRGADAIYPDFREDFLAPIPEAERDDVLAAFQKRFHSEDKEVALQAARAWSIWEGRTSNLHPDMDVSRTSEEEFAVAFANLELHYFTNGCWLEEGQLLRDVDKIRHIPAVIVQGRYDMICPMENCWALHKAWPEADLVVVPDAGHAAFEPGTVRALVAACDRFASPG